MPVFHHESLRHRLGALRRDIQELIEEIEQSDVHAADVVDAEIHRLVSWWDEYKPQPAPPVSNEPATSLTLTIEGASEMASFNIDDKAGIATLQFTGGTGNPVEGPLDSVTGQPIVPSIVSDNEAVETVGTVVAGEAPGSFSAPLTEVAAGTSNLSVAPLTNSDGSPVLETYGPNTGEPFHVGDPVAVTVTDLPEGLSLSAGDGPAPIAAAPAPTDPAADPTPGPTETGGTDTSAAPTGGQAAPPEAPSASEDASTDAGGSTADAGTVAPDGAGVTDPGTTDAPSTDTPTV